jgi:hypothetical protein
MLDALVDLPWRAIPSLLIAAGGLLLVLRGVRMAWGWSRYRDPARNLAFIRGFRLAVVGLALAGIAAAWTWHLGWLLALALIIGIGELLESSLDAWAVRRGIRRGYVPARSGGPPSGR